MIECVACHTPLTGGLDTFGDVHLPMCQNCFWEIWHEVEERRIFRVLELDGVGRVVGEGIRIEASGDMVHEDCVIVYENCLPGEHNV